MNKPAVSQAKMQRMARAIEKAGLPFRGFRMLPDGSVEALVGEPDLTPPPEPASKSDPLDAELEDWDKQHGYG